LELGFDPPGYHRHRSVLVPVVNPRLEEDTHMTVGDIVKANPDPGCFPFFGFGSWGMLLILLAIIVLAAFLPRFGW
ncbi:MAG: hypothetical protein KA064_02150, partial [Firmicutes bacterium]|nr:hypothetical protein [Bacillota bacterium]